MAASELEVSSINGSTVQSWAKALVRIYSGEAYADAAARKTLAKPSSPTRLQVAFICWLYSLLPISLPSRRMVL